MHTLCCLFSLFFSYFVVVDHFAFGLQHFKGNKNIRFGYSFLEATVEDWGEDLHV